jgi:tape measure domain-containing protein
MASVGAVKAGEAFVKVFSDDTALVRGLRGIEAKYKQLGSNIAGVGAQITGLGTAVASVGAVSLAALSWPLSLASNMENTEAAFTTLLKDGDKARSLMEDLAAFAASTPFQFDELANAGKKLLAFGSEAGNVKTELRSIGDIASAIGAPIGEIAELYGKARVQGRLFGEDINQLTGRGIPIIQELAKQFGVADSEVKALVEDGQIGFGNLEKAFISLTTGAGQFAGGMERQSKTLSGSFSTLRDNIAAAFRPFGEVLLPFAKKALDVGTKLVSKFAEFAKNNKQLVIPLAAALAAITAIGSVVATVGGSVFALGAAIAAVGSAAGTLAGIATTIGATLGVPFAIAAVLAAGLVAEMAIVATTVAAVGAGFVYLANEVGVLVPAFNFVKGAILEVFGTFKQTFGGMIAALGSGQFGLAAQIAWQGVKVATLQGSQSVLQGIEYLWKNAGTLTIMFLQKLGSLVIKAFAALPKLAFAALRGGAGIVDILNGVFADAFSSGSFASALDGPIAEAQKKLDALTMQANATAPVVNVGSPPAAAPARNANPIEAAQAAQISEKTQTLEEAKTFALSYITGKVPGAATAPQNTTVNNSFQGESVGEILSEQLVVLKRLLVLGGLQ